MYLGDLQHNVHLFSSQLIWTIYLYKRYPFQVSLWLITMNIKSDWFYVFTERKDKIWRWCFKLHLLINNTARLFIFLKAKQIGTNLFQLFRELSLITFCGQKENLNSIRFAKPWTTNTIFLFQTNLLLMKDNCFTILCWFLPYISHRYTCLLSHEPPSHSTITLNAFIFAILYRNESHCIFNLKPYSALSAGIQAKLFHKSKQSSQKEVIGAKHSDCCQGNYLKWESDEWALPCLHLVRDSG